jgi:hypothetical protein
MQLGCEVNRLFINVLRDFVTAGLSYSILLQCLIAMFFTSLAASGSDTAKKHRYMIHQQGG